MRRFPTRSFGIPRRWSNRILKRIAPVFTGEVLNVSGWEDRDKQGSAYREYFSGATRYFVSNTSGERGLSSASEVTDFEIDLMEPVPAELSGRFDVAFSHTTLEHVPSIEEAFRNLAALSRDVLIVVVPFAQEVHTTASYGDYWRFTPMGIRHLMESNGFEVIFEDASRTSNAGIYVLVVGSRHPDRWRDQVPNPEPIAELGTWIGGSGPRNFFRRLINALLPHRSDRPT